MTDQPSPEVGNEPARRRTVVKVGLIAAVVGAVVGAGAGVGAYASVDAHEMSGSSTSSTPTASPSGSRGSASGPDVTGTTGQTYQVSVAAKDIAPSVVTISAVGQQQAGTGSGVILRADGYILTNDHVVTLDNQAQPSSLTVTATLNNGKSYPAKVVGTDQTDDLAVIKVNASALTPAHFADSSKLVVGEPVVAVGAPLGLSATVTSGIVSALDRPVASGSQGQSIFDAIQTDAAINPGNSGGPLVDLNGDVVGIDSAIASLSQGSAQAGSIGIGFAIPSSEAQRIAQEIIKTGHASHAVIGVQVSNAQGQNGQGPTSALGATVTSVQPGSPAAQAGIQPGDVITQVGDQRVDGTVGLVAAIRSHAPGQKVTLTVQRNGTAIHLPVTLGSQQGS